jgi:hypothetical protein
VDPVVPASLDVALIVEHGGDRNLLPVRWIARRSRYRVAEVENRADWLGRVTGCLDHVRPELRECKIPLTSRLALKIAIGAYLAFVPAPQRAFAWARPDHRCGRFPGNEWQVV